MRHEPMNAGEVSILSVGEGHISLSFNSDDPAEVIRASRIVKDMLRRGYALLVKTPDQKWSRAKDFDENTNEYLIADLDAEPQPEDTSPTYSATVGSTAESSVSSKLRRGRPPMKRVSAKESELVSVGRTAGG